MIGIGVPVRKRGFQTFLNNILTHLKSAHILGLDILEHLWRHGKCYGFGFVPSA